MGKRGGWQTGDWEARATMQSRSSCAGLFQLRSSPSVRQDASTEVPSPARPPCAFTTTRYTHREHPQTKSRTHATVNGTAHLQFKRQGREGGGGGGRVEGGRLEAGSDSLPPNYVLQKKSVLGSSSPQEIGGALVTKGAATHRQNGQTTIDRKLYKPRTIQKESSVRHDRDPISRDRMH